MFRAGSLVLGAMILCSMLNLLAAFVLQQPFAPSDRLGKMFTGVVRDHNAFKFCALYAVNKKSKAGSVGLEFSRVINVGQIPRAKPVLCRLLAKEAERQGLCARFDIPQLPYFAANVTLSRRDEHSVLVVGSIEAHVKSGEMMDVEVLRSDFDTLLLNNEGGDLNIEDETDFDDEVGPGGEIDIGEIAAQYLALEMY
ncbi:hypothetical protein B484DRAFT_392269 [Ochromonadaceae sp. CCMP2298]|nr:hypothetical protein B484DRAFT_392269 [Ochromonadaceae sp. CCMP2298]|mmetsp:Transcript_15706/g.34719  ORF Transcript_15706/g.34719 Transcript_15706/m.34719 type:complete len:197 (+) Transcript_15706:58-648(+)|eukprot:CAMPEP_0173288360 /NCGR_PEP_ID=MMETSP1143-20121109/10367_1 /TAXON_ID=483371 /ORGANISM="non described non described, Strain CCMP2298" /LENGTH=196 /DNA_ID=CAMNT_0014227103 /DNA_START=1 /DNA_END=591 /DNA_ORIENTATION=-